MKPTRNEQRLAAALLARRSGCPKADELQSYHDGELDTAPRERVGGHVARCEDCAAALRFLGEEGAPESVEPPLDVLRRSDRLIDTLQRESSRRRRGALAGYWSWGLGLAAAVAALLLVVLLPRGGEAPAPPVQRGDEQEVLCSLVPEDRPLPREGFLLRWVAGPEGSRYDLTVLDERLGTVLAVQGLDRAEHRVPTEALDGLPAGARLHWQVEAVLPDGGRRTSVSFLAQVE